jgi:hypothetical protein
VGSLKQLDLQGCSSLELLPEAVAYCAVLTSLNTDPLLQTVFRGGSILKALAVQRVVNPRLQTKSGWPHRNSYYAMTIVFEARGQGTQGTVPDLPTFVLSCASVDTRHARFKVHSTA